MTDEARCVSFFKRKKNKGAIVTNDEFQRAIEDLKSVVDTGFNNYEIEILVGFLLKPNLVSSRFTSLIKCIVPNTTVPKTAIENILLWVFSHYHTAGAASLVSALQWISGILEYGLGDKEVINGYYELFYVLLRKESLQKHACKLIYLLTESEDITRWKVQDVLNLHVNNKRAKHTNALLSLFKSRRPDLVPESIPSYNIHAAFSSVHWLTAHFQRARLRNQMDLNLVENRLTSNISWHESGAFSRRTKRAKLDLIPPVTYLTTRENIYNENRKWNILKCTSMESIGIRQLSLDIPCHASSLLLNAAGHHIIAFSKGDFQSRFSCTIYFRLQYAFFRETSKGHTAEKENFLQQLWNLEEYMQQGIHVVSIFLAEFLTTWDGEDFKPYIFKLLEWITFTSFVELRDGVLDCLQTIFISSHIETKCLIIATLRKMVCNLFNAKRCLGDKTPSSIFLVPAPLDVNDTLPEIITFVERLCSLGLTVEQENVALLDESISFFEMVSYLEQSSNVPFMTVIPPDIVYRGIFSRNISFLDRICALLVSYKFSHNKRLKSLGIRIIFKHKFEMVNMYATDVKNFLDGEGLSKSENGFIFNGLSTKTYDKLSKWVNLDSAFSLRNHIGLNTHTLKFESKATPNQVMILLGPYIQNILKIANQ